MNKREKEIKIETLHKIGREFGSKGQFIEWIKKRTGIQILESLLISSSIF
ncbi:MAG: hypothetical protein ACMUIU_06135 [bacterium]